MKKVCIISITNLFLCPYIGKYISLMPDDVSLDLVYWNRHGINEDVSAFDNVYSFDVPMNERIKRSQKLLKVLRFGKYCQSVMKKKKYDKIIILHNIMAVALIPFLQRHYKHNYLIDIRDYSFEKNRIFYKMEQSAISNSGLAVISSEGYRHFLPEWDYAVCHNDPSVDEETIERVTSVKNDKDKPIQISFIGLVRFFGQNKRLLDLLGNDKRFVLGFFGQNSDKLKEYAENNGINNTLFVGRFDPSETVSFYVDTSIINNYYGNNTPVLDYALSNKLYYAAYFKKPILVCPDTYMSELAEKYHFGITLKDEDTADDLYNAYVSMDQEKLKEGCRLFLEKVENDNKRFYDRLVAFLYS